MATPKGQARTLAENRKARFHYEIEDTLEAGIALTGTEVKSLRTGRATIAESYASPEDGGLWLINATIPEYGPANRFNHAPKRRRQLLLHRREIERLRGQVERKSMALIPLSLYFNGKGLVKLTLGLARGKKDHDKRETIKERDWNRQKSRLLKQSV